jgi:hypothetical protein
LLIVQVCVLRRGADCIPPFFLSIVGKRGIESCAFVGHNLVDRVLILRVGAELEFRWVAGTDLKSAPTR